MVFGRLRKNHVTVTAWFLRLRTKFYFILSLKPCYCSISTFWITKIVNGFCQYHQYVSIKPVVNTEFQTTEFWVILTLGSHIAKRPFNKQWISGRILCCPAFLEEKHDNFYYLAQKYLLHCFCSNNTQYPCLAEYSGRILLQLFIWGNP